MNDEKILYRYHHITYASPLDEYDNVCGVGRTVLDLQKYSVVKESEKSYWIKRKIGQWYDPDIKIIRKNAYRRFAHENKKDALSALVKRKEKEISICQSRIDNRKKVINLANKEIENIDVQQD